MRLRKLALAVGLAGTMGAQMASALGLGEIKLHSKLNEPLNAEIRLLQVKDLSKNEVLVELASNDDFKRAGIDRVFFLTDLRFEVVLDAPAGPVIRVTSQKPVKEPYLNFLLESQWPNGRILREYTLLMDLPTFSEQRPAPVQSASTSIPSPSSTTARTGTAPAAAPRAAQTTASTPAARTPAATTPATAPAYQGDVYGPVGANDTLWEIALKVRPNRQYSVQQTMLALQQLNPDAFINGNINLLREGQVLRVPASTDIDNIGAQQAVSEVAQQNSAWSELRGAATGPQLEGSKRARQASSASDSGISGRLTVGGAGAAESGQAGRASGGDSAALQSELSASLEELDSARRENTELKDRVAEMEEQIKTMERLLEVSSEEFRALQQSIAARNAEQGADSSESVAQGAEAPATDAGGTSAITASPVDEDAEVTGDPAAAGAQDEQTAAAEAESAAPAPVVQPPAEAKGRDTSRVVQSAPAKQPSFLDLVLDNILYVGAGILAILLAALFFLRRRKTEEEPQEPTDEVGVVPVAAAAAAAATTADIDAAIESGVADDFSMAYDDVDLAEEDDLFAEEEAAIEPQTGDAVAEADIYISYGKLEQAEDLLQQALEQDPDNTDARLKLLEVYAAGQNLEKFDQQMAEVMATGDAAALERAECMRQQFADAPAYQPADDADNEFALGDDTLDLDFELGDDSLSEESPSTAAPEFELGEDFGLRFAASLTSADNRDADAAAADEEGLSLELDEAMLAAEEDFLADLDNSLEDLDNNLDLDNSLAGLDGGDELTFDLAGDEEPLTLDLDLSELDAAETTLEDTFGNVPAVDAAGEELEELDLDSLADEDDAFDLDMEEMDLAALDEEVSALSENIDFAGEEFGFDEESDLENSVTLEDIQPAAGTDSAADAADAADLGELDLTLDEEDDELSLDTLELEDLSFEGDDLAPEKGDLSLDLDDDFSADFAAALAEDEVPTLSLDDSEPVSELPADDLTLAAFDSAAETDSADAPGFDESEFEEFDLAADLGLDESDFATSEDDLAEDALFSEALSELPTPEDVMAEDANEDDFDAELDFLADTDEAATKLDLARAYIDMGDQEGAKDILSEVVVEGNETQKLEAEELLSRLG